MESVGSSITDWQKGPNFVCFISYVLMFSITDSEKLNSSIIIENEGGSGSFNVKLVTPKVIEKVDDGWNEIVSMILRVTGGIFVGILMEVIGRKRSMQLNVVLVITGLLFIIFPKMSDTIILKFIGQSIIKFATGMEACILVYIAETYLPMKRAIFLAGLLPVTLLAEFKPPITTLFNIEFSAEQTEAKALIIMLLACVFLSIYCPESPVWLKHKNVFEPVDVIDLADIRINQNKIDEEENAYEKNQEPELISFARKLGNLYVWKHFFTLAGIFTKITLLDVGLSKFLDDYKAELLTEHTGSSDLFDKSQVTIFPIQTKHFHEISFIAVLCSSVVGVFVVGLINRKVLSGVGWFCITISCLIGCTYEVLYNEVDVYYRPTRFCFLPIICIWMSKVFLTIGGRMIMIVMFGELFPASIRGFISGLLWSFLVMVAFIVEEFMHPFLESKLNMASLFAIYAGMGFQMFLVNAFVMPETRGRTLMQIEHQNSSKSVIKRLRCQIQFLTRLWVVHRSEA